MNGSWKLPVAGLLAFGVMASAHGARAQTSLMIANGDVFMADGMMFTVSNCSYVVNGSSDGCSNAKIEIKETTAADGGVNLELMGSGSGSASNALSGTPASGKVTELSFSLKVTPVGFGEAGVKAVSNAISGSAGKGSTDVFSKVTYGSLSADTTLASANASLSVPTGSQNSALSVNVSMGLQSPGTNLVLASDTLHFSPAPEPASVALLMTGVGCLAFARRRSRRSTGAAQSV